MDHGDGEEEVVDPSRMPSRRSECEVGSERHAPEGDRASSGLVEREPPPGSEIPVHVGELEGTRATTVPGEVRIDPSPSLTASKDPLEIADGGR